MSKHIDLEGLKVFKGQTDELYVGQEPGKSLIETTKITKLDGIEDGAQKNNIKKVQIGAVEQDISEDGTLTLDVESVIAGDNLVTDTELSEQLTPYLKSTDADSKFASKEDVGKLGTIQGSCLKEDLTTKKDSAKTNDVWIVTDDDNHMYFYNGTDFVDTQAKAHVDLSNYVQTETLSDYVTNSNLTTQLQDYAEKTSLNEYLTKAEVEFASEEEIKSEVFGIGA